MSDTHYGTDARLMELEMEIGRGRGRRHHRPVSAGPAGSTRTRHRLATRLRRAADRLDG